jgi:hypothetical protein
MFALKRYLTDWPSNKGRQNKQGLPKTGLRKRKQRKCTNIGEDRQASEALDQGS